MRGTKSARPLYYGLALILCVLVLYPFGVLVLSSFFTGQPGRLGSPTLAGYRIWVTSQGLLPIIRNSVIFAAARTGVSLVFALIFAWSVARTNVPGKRMMQWLIPIPFFVPDLLTGISWLMLGNPQNGLLNQWAASLFGTTESVINLYGWGGLIFHSCLNMISFMFLMLVGFFKSMGAAYEEAALTSGAGKFRVLTTVTFPMLAPAILGVSLLVFIHGLEAFDSPLLFGNPGGVYVFSNEIYRLLSNRFPPQYNAATGLSVIVTAVTFLLLVLQERLTGKRDVTSVTGKGHRASEIRLPAPARWGIFAVFVIYFLLAVVIPVLQILVNSFFEVFGFYTLDGLTLDNWRNLLGDDRAVTGFVNTLVFASAAAVAVVILGGLVAYVRVRTRHWLGRPLELLAWAPWTLPGVVMGLALLWAWAWPPPPFNLYGSALVIVIGFMVKGLPLGTATIVAAMRQLSPEFEESARVHGASWLRTAGSILAPLLRRGAVATFIVVFAVASRDLTIPLLLYRGGTETITVVLLHYYQESAMGTLAAFAVVQFLLVMLLLAGEWAIRPREDR